MKTDIVILYHLFDDSNWFGNGCLNQAGSIKGYLWEFANSSPYPLPHGENGLKKKAIKLRLNIKGLLTAPILEVSRAIQVEFR